MNCYTIESGKVTAGIAVQKMSLVGAGVEIDAVLVGEDGRGRRLGVLPVGGHPEGPMVPCDHSQWCTGYTKTCPDCGLPAGPMRAGNGRETDKPEHRGEKRGERPMLLTADVGQTRAGRPKLVRETSQAKSADCCIVAFRTGMGYRGGNSHTGDLLSTPCPHRGEQVDGYECAKCKIPRPSEIEGDYYVAWTHPAAGEIRKFAPFPGEVICEGEIAQGGAGRMGSGRQLVAIIPRGVVFRTGYSGRLYGRPGAHYYVFDGERILAMTWEERVASDCF